LLGVKCLKLQSVIFEKLLRYAISNQYRQFLIILETNDIRKKVLNTLTNTGTDNTANFIGFIYPMKNFRILIVGCGDLGCALGQELSNNHQVHGLRRNTQLLPASIHPIKADFNNPSTLTNLPLIDILIYCAAPNRLINDSYEDTYINGFNHIINHLPSPPLHTFFISSTSVYAQHQYQWINEHSITQPTTANAKIMLRAEKQALATLNTTVIRFSGIYSSQRLHLFKQVISGKSHSFSPAQFSNRIHLDDCVGVIAHFIMKLADQQVIAPLYLASDMCPAPISEVMNWIAKQTHTTTSSIEQSKRSNGKRCDNQLLINSGYQFLHPDYRSGYRQAIDKHLSQCEKKSTPL
jgi:dTDP-4-dehydrorhamnose reductase